MTLRNILDSNDARDVCRLVEALTSAVAYGTIFKPNVLLAAADYIRSSRFCSEANEREIAEHFARFLEREAKDAAHGETDDQS